MTLYEITETLIRAANGGNFSSDMKWDIPYIESVVHQVREQAIIASYNGNQMTGANKTMSPDWLQKNTYTSFTKVENEKEPSYLTTSALPVVRVNSNQTGVAYQGTAGATQKFYEALTKGQINTWYTQGFFKNNKRVAILRTGEKMEIYGNTLLSSISEEAIYQRPDLVAGWNYDTSRYPINEGLVPMMKMLFVQQVRPEMMVAKDIVSDRAVTL
jgi:hypothetical protein